MRVEPVDERDPFSFDQPQCFRRVECGHQHLARSGNWGHQGGLIDAEHVDER